MKKTIQYLLAGFSVVFIVLLYSCNQKKKIDFSVMHVYNAEQLQKIVDNAFKIERVDSPIVQKTGNSNGGSTVIRTTQVYRVFVATTKDNHIMPISDVTEAARKASVDGPIIITASCEMTCTPVRPGETCNISGCFPTDKCGCTQGSCGNNCTTDVMCHQGLTGFGFGKLIMF